MSWKEVYDKCNNKKFSAIININQPVTLKSTFGIFLDKYKIIIFIGVLLISTASVFIYKVSIKVFLSVLAIFAMLTVALIYYNTFKIELKNDNLHLNIMFRDITIKQGDLANIYISKQNSRIFLIIPLYFYSINILYSDKGVLKGYSLSTTMTRKEDVVKFFEHFEFIKLKKQNEEDKRDNINEAIRRIVTVFITIVFIFIALLYLFR